jgi:hypothetical protein
MKTAVCISGQCRTLNQTHENIRQNLLERIGDYDLFMYVPKDEYSHHAHLLNPTVLKIADDRHIDEGDLINGINCRFKTGVQSYLQQLYALKLCGQLRLPYEQENGFVYDCIIRCRPDILFMSPVPEIENLDLDCVYLPDFHHFDGCNDRFAIGNSSNMAIYFSKIDCIHEYVRDYFVNKAIPLSAEMFTMIHLRANNIPTEILPIRFNRVRTHGMINDLKKTNRKIKAG